MSEVEPPPALLNWTMHHDLSEAILGSPGGEGSEDLGRDFFPQPFKLLAFELRHTHHAGLEK